MPAAAIVCLVAGWFGSFAAASDEPAVMRERAFTAYAEKRTADAVQLFGDYLRRCPGDTEVLEVLGYIQYKAEDLDEAGRSLERAVAIEPESAYGWFMLGNVRYRQFRLSEALEAYRRVRSLEPDYPNLEENMELLRQRIERVSELRRLRRRGGAVYWAVIGAGALFLALAGWGEFRDARRRRRGALENA